MYLTVLIRSLFLTCSKLYWIGSYDAEVDSSIEPRGWSVDYKNVLLHAISKPDQTRPSIYLQLSCNKILDHNGNEINADREDDDDDEKFVEVNLFVKGIREADEMFVALSECASLHGNESDSENESESELDYENETVEVKGENVNETPAVVKKCKIDEERFEDAAEN